MANALYDPGREGFLDGSIDWDTGTVKVSLIRGYTFSAAHKFVSDATGAGASLVATGTLGSKTVTDGVADAADITFSAVTSGAACQALLIYQTSAPSGGADLAASAQRLIAYIDTATNLPISPNGGDINIVWDAGANRVFRL